MGEYKTVVSGLVSEHVADVILGISWLTENQVTWEFSNSRICVGGVYHELRCRPDANIWCRRVVSQARVVIPPGSEIDVLTKVLFKTLSVTSDCAGGC